MSVDAIAPGNGVPLAVFGGRTFHDLPRNLARRAVTPKRPPPDRRTGERGSWAFAWGVAKD
jgi:hypothetical protein